MFTFIYRKPSDLSYFRPSRLFRPIRLIYVRLYYFLRSSDLSHFRPIIHLTSDCIISSDQIITSDFLRFVLFSSIQLISSDHLISSITSVHLNFVRPYYFRLSYLPVQFSLSYFALFYILIQI